METSEGLKKRATDLISKHIGRDISKQYADFYADKTDEEVLTSIQELLIEYLGEKKGTEEFDLFKK